MLSKARRWRRLRDIEKDKNYVTYAGGLEELAWPLVIECCDIAKHWIAQYERLQKVYGEVYESYERITNDMEKDYYRLRDRYEAAQARIHELEELLRKDSEKTP
jgi:hypothetical protein